MDSHKFNMGDSFDWSVFDALVEPRSPNVLRGHDIKELPPDEVAAILAGLEQNNPSLGTSLIDPWADGSPPDPFDQNRYSGQKDTPVLKSNAATAIQSTPCPHPGCVRSFRRLDALRRHISIHSASNARFPCPLCEEYQGNRAFARKDHRNQHIRKKHNKTPYQCPANGCDRIDGKGWFRESDRKTHQQIAHPEIPYETLSLMNDAIDALQPESLKKYNTIPPNQHHRSTAPQFLEPHFQEASRSGFDRIGSMDENNEESLEPVHITKEPSVTGTIPFTEISEGGVALPKWTEHGLDKFHDGDINKRQLASRTTTLPVSDAQRELAQIKSMDTAEGSSSSGISADDSSSPIFDSPEPAEPVQDTPRENIHQLSSLSERTECHSRDDFQHDQLTPDPRIPDGARTVASHTSVLAVQSGLGAMNTLDMSVGRDLRSRVNQVVTITHNIISLVRSKVTTKHEAYASSSKPTPKNAATRHSDALDTDPPYQGVNDESMTQYLNTLLDQLSDALAADKQTGRPIAETHSAWVVSIADEIISHIDSIESDLTKLADSHPGGRVDPQYAGFSAAYQVVRRIGLLFLEQVSAPRNRTKVQTTEHDNWLQDAGDDEKSVGNRTPVVRSLSDSDASEVDDVFSDSISVAPSTSTSSMTHEQITSVREIATTLLAHEELASLFTRALSKVDFRKAKRHFRGFLRKYAQNLLKETSDAVLHVKAASFIQNSAARIATQICSDINRIVEEKRSRQPDDHALSKENLERLLSSFGATGHNVESVTGGFQTREPSEGDAESSGDDSDDEAPDDLQMPNIDKIKDFLTSATALIVLIEDLKAWLKVNGERFQDALEHQSPMVMHRQAPGRPTDAISSSSSCDGGFWDAEEHRWEEQQGPVSINEAAVQQASNIVSSPERGSHAAPNRCAKPDRRLSSLLNQVSAGLDTWANYFLPSDGFALFQPAIPIGHKRLKWRCDCGTHLWGDFLSDGPPTLRQPEPASVQTQSGDTATNAASIGASALIKSVLGAVKGLTAHKSRGSDQSQRNGIVDLIAAPTPHSICIPYSPRFFELCVNIGDFAIAHHELDIGNIHTDRELFRLIWDKYDACRGIARRLFLRPRNVHFVLFSIDRLSEDGAGIHKKPNEFPPETEIRMNRYHYEFPQIRMPVNVFLHYLHRARSGTFRKHDGNTWLQHLPKKLNKRLVEEQTLVLRDDDQGETSIFSNPNLAFGWGVHIIDGPNHAVLGVLLAIGLIMAFVISGMIVGFAKTQEQGFGIGSFLLSVMTTVMAAVYFQLQDM